MPLRTGLGRKAMGKKIAIVGAGAVGGYTGAHMAQAGEDVTFIDPWPEHVEEIKKNGLRITHHQGEEPFTARAQEVLRLVSHADSAKATDNLWGERWSKLVTNSMANGVSASTGLSGAAMAQEERVRRFQARVGSEAIRIGQALGYKLEEIN